MIRINIETDTADEAVAEMKALVGFMAPAQGMAAPTPAAEIVTPKTRKTKSAPIEKAPESEITDIQPEPEAPKVDETPEPTEDQVKDAIKALNAAQGEDACWALLKKYGAKKRSEVKDTRAFVKEAYELKVASEGVILDFVKKYGEPK